jgi:hypothetical protein
MANEQNLTPFTSEQNREEAAKNGRKGGIESGKKRRLQGAIERAMDSKATEEFAEIFREFNVDENDKTFASALACVLVKRAAQGSLDAIAMVRDTIGEKPKDEISLEGGVVIVDDLNKA